MSGMDLLLQAVEYRSPATSTTTTSACKRGSRSLPPKKRIKQSFDPSSFDVSNTFLSLDAPTLISHGSVSGSGRSRSTTDSPTMISDVTSPSVNVNDIMRRNELFCPPVNLIIPTRSRALKRRKKNSLAVKDVNGNDMSMGYFSMNASSSASLTEVTSEGSTSTDEDEVEQQHSSCSEESMAPPLVSTDDVKKSDSSLCNEAKSKLYEAYLRAQRNSVSSSVTPEATATSTDDVMSTSSLQKSSTLLEASTSKMGTIKDTNSADALLMCEEAKSKLYEAYLQALANPNTNQ